MIKIEFSLAVALYLILTTCFVLLIIIFKNRKEPKQFFSENIFLWQCSICTYVYVDSRHANISQCPRCGSYNSKEENMGTPVRQSTGAPVKK
jgi:hypothetical protein